MNTNIICSAEIKCEIDDEIIATEACNTENIVEKPENEVLDHMRTADTSISPSGLELEADDEMKTKTGKELSDMNPAAELSSKTEESMLFSSNSLNGAPISVYKVLRKYKAAVRICDILKNREVFELSPKDTESLRWANGVVAEGRCHFANDERYKTDNPLFANKLEEDVITRLALKRQRTLEENSTQGQAPKRSKLASSVDPPAVRPLLNKAIKSRQIVALLDRSDPLGKITHERWKLVECKLLEALIERMETLPDQPMPTFDEANWFNGVKLIACMDQLSLDWCSDNVKSIKGLWEGADLNIVEISKLSFPPNAKVAFPCKLAQESTLKLLQRQNPDIPTQDWKVLKVIEPADTEAGQIIILQINKTAENLLYPRCGKMAWGMSYVYLRLKKRSLSDENNNTLEANEVEKDLGLESLIETFIDSAQRENGPRDEFSTNKFSSQ